MASSKDPLIDQYTTNDVVLVIKREPNDPTPVMLEANAALLISVSKFFRSLLNEDSPGEGVEVIKSPTVHYVVNSALTYVKPEDVRLFLDASLAGTSILRDAVEGVRLASMAHRLQAAEIRGMAQQFVEQNLNEANAYEVHLLTNRCSKLITCEQFNQQVYKAAVVHCEHGLRDKAEWVLSKDEGEMTLVISDHKIDLCTKFVRKIAPNFYDLVLGGGDAETIEVKMTVGPPKHFTVCISNVHVTDVRSFANFASGEPIPDVFTAVRMAAFAQRIREEKLREGIVAYVKKRLNKENVNEVRK